MVPFKYSLHKLHCLWSLTNGHFSLEYLVWASLRIKAAVYGFTVSVPTVGLRLLDVLLFHPTVVRGFPGHPRILSISLPTCFHVSGIPSSACDEETGFLCLALPVEYFRQSFHFKQDHLSEMHRHQGWGLWSHPALSYLFIPTPGFLSKACSTIIEVFFTRGEFSLKRSIFYPYSLAFYGTSNCKDFSGSK